MIFARFKPQNFAKGAYRLLQTNVKPSDVAPISSPKVLHLSEAFKSEPQLADKLRNTMLLHPDFLSAADEAKIMEEIEPYLKRMRYEYDHWDDAIHGFRETERLKWNEENTKTLDRVRALAFPPNVNQLKFVHILDLDEKGYIKPHIDAIRFCGNTIAGLSLLSDSVMRLVHDKRKELFADVLLRRRSLYIMKDEARFDYTHEILKGEESFFLGDAVKKTRRVSVICRNEPNPEDTKI